jgi:hypothetical protein
MNIRSVILGMLIGAILAAPVFVTSHELIVDYSKDAFFIIFLLLIGATFGFISFWFFYRKAFGKFLNFSASSLEKIADSLVASAFAVADKRFADAEKEARATASRVGAWISNALFVRTVFSILISIFAVMATTFGTIVLIQQNKIIENQSGILKDQTKQISSQTLLAKLAYHDIINKKINSISDTTFNIQKVISAYTAKKTQEIRVSGRSRKKNDVDEPAAVTYSIKAPEFKIEACEKNIKGHPLTTDGKQSCLSLELSTLSPALKDATFELNDNNVGLLSIITWIAEVSAAHEQALNPTFDRGDKAEPRKYLGNYITAAQVDCNLDPASGGEARSLAQEVRLLEEAGQRLQWLFRFGFPKDDQDVKLRHEQQLQAATGELLFRVLNIGMRFKLLEGRQSDKPVTVNEAVASIKTVYEKVAGAIKDIETRCEASRKELVVLEAEINPLRDLKTVAGTL